MVSADTIFYYIRMMVASMLGRVDITIEEVEEIYDSGKYPEINANIDYIVFGKKSQKGLDK